LRERGLGITTAQLEASAGALTAGAVYRISGSGAGLGTAGFAGGGVVLRVVETQQRQ